MQVKEETYDTILIGAGVVNIIEAAYLKSQGKSVLILEASDVAAGAWSTVSHDTIPEIEIGCHIWDIAKGAPEFLAHIFELNLVHLKPNPRLYTKGMRLPYDWKANAITLKRQLRHLKRLKFSYIRADLKQPYSRLNLWPSKYVYPQQGAFELKRGIQKFIDKHAVEIQFNANVTSMDVSDQVVLETEEGNTFTSNEVVITSLCKVPKVTVNGTEHVNTTRHTDYIHVHLIVKNARKKAFSYDRIMGNDLVHRISDMTSQVREQLNEDEMLVCAGVFQKAFHAMNREEVAQTVLNVLINLGYVNPASELVASGINVFSAYYTETGLLNAITDQSGGKVRVLHSTNLTYSIYAQLNRWRSLMQ